MQNSPPRILLVDDEPNNIRLLEALLQSEDYITLAASSGVEALAIANASPPDIILLDIMMPEMDGFEVCKQLRADPKCQTLPVIFLTALDDDNSRLRGLELMGDDYLTKPIKSQLLLTKIASIWRLQQMRSQQIQQQVSEELKEKNKLQLCAAWNINQALSEKLRLFVPDQYLRRIAPSGVESIQLGNAKEEEISVLFGDIRGFTTISESQSASETFNWLNAFFTQMNSCIIAHNGFIDKYLGDALMAVFDRSGHHAQDALSAAVMMQESLREFNRGRDRYNLDQPLKIGIGIHSGKAVIGALGADSRLDSTVIGDVVNTAARLEELTKHYNCGIITSEESIAQLNQPELFHLRWIDRVVPRGKQQAQDIYEVLGTATQPLNVARVLT
ncbi:response regulator [Argonema galeatum]|uniref:response regulator n=1 Tax=Argonema galeatum TaxID=2942762 RepID=UPI0020135BE8|nr:response regulator [Argonema galeatum]MCL1465650.1 response regulator [Argonema galeatum A003/A1]